MFKKLALAFTAAALAAGCAGSASNTSNAGARVSDGKVDVGDRVLVQSDLSKSMYYEGEARSISGSRVKVELRMPSGSAEGFVYKDAESEVSEAYEAPSRGSRVDVKVGDVVLARRPGGEANQSPIWDGAEVVAVSNLGIQVKGLGQNKQPWTPGFDEVVKPSEKTAAELKESGAASMLLADARKHRPVAPEGYTPKAGDRVLAEAFVGSWYSGIVTNVSGARKSVKYDDPANKLTEPVYTVVPLPTAADSPTPADGQYLLVKPPSGDRWLYAQVTKVNGKTAEVRVEDGKTRTVAPGEFLTLEAEAY